MHDDILPTPDVPNPLSAEDLPTPNELPDPYEAIGRFVQLAERYGLLVECLGHVLLNTSDEQPLAERLAEALYEWDI